MAPRGILEDDRDFLDNGSPLDSPNKSHSQIAAIPLVFTDRNAFTAAIYNELGNVDLVVQLHKIPVPLRRRIRDGGEYPLEGETRQIGVGRPPDGDTPIRKLNPLPKSTQPSIFSPRICENKIIGQLFLRLVHNLHIRNSDARHAPLRELHRPFEQIPKNFRPVIVNPFIEIIVLARY